MNQETKTLQRALKEIENLKSEISILKKVNKPVEKKPDIWESKSGRVRSIDKLTEGRDEAMNRFSMKLFGRIYAKQEQN